MNTPVQRVEANPSGRDFVVGDVHGCFRTLDRALVAIHFDPARDRLFGLGDLINRGPHSEETLDWLRERRIRSTLGNHEDTMLDRLKRPNFYEYADVHAKWQQWIDEEDLPRWREAIEGMPVAMTVETRHGRVGIIHAGPVSRSWTATLAELRAGSLGTVSTALYGGYEGAGASWRGRPGTPVEGVRAVVTGHVPHREVRQDGPWCIDTGAGTPWGRLTVLQIDCDPPVPTTVELVPGERPASRDRSSAI